MSQRVETLVLFNPPLEFQGDRYQTAFAIISEIGRENVKVATYGMNLLAVWFSDPTQALMFKLRV